MSTYAVSMDCPHATAPDVLWHVPIYDEINGGAINPEMPRHSIWVPRLDGWTLDTLRMVLHELAAYLPAHDEALVAIAAKTHRPAGRQRKNGPPRPPRFSERVTISVAARGWRAEVHAHRNEASDTTGKVLGLTPGAWSEPMQAILLDLAAQSPFPLSTVRPVNCAKDLSVPSRRDVVAGIKPDPDKTTSYVAALAKTISRLERRIADIEADLEAGDDE